MVFFQAQNGFKAGAAQARRTPARLKNPAHGLPGARSATGRCWWETARRLHQAILIHIIGNQKIVPLGTVFMEVPPDTGGVLVQKFAVVGRNRLALARRLIEPDGDGVGESP